LRPDAQFALLTAVGGPEDLGLPVFETARDTPRQRTFGEARDKARARLEAWVLDHEEEILVRRAEPIIQPGELVISAQGAPEERLFPLDPSTAPASAQLDSLAAPLVESIFRCHQSGEEHEMSPITIALLAEASWFFQAPIRLVSGYRAPRFCARPESRHKYGRAADVRLDGIPMEVLADFFTLFSDGPYGPMGVGRYPRDGFVHVDSRDETYFWTGNERRRRRHRTHR
jgi:hypothetical protein